MQELFCSCAGVDAAKNPGLHPRHPHELTVADIGFQILRLDLSPAFEWDPHDHAWQENFDDCVQHDDLTGKLPYLNGADWREFALARWLGLQLRQLQMGTQSESRAAQLAVLMALQNTGSGLRHSR